MRARGMTYDTGLVVHGQMSREHFEPEVVRRELAIIRDDLHCDAVQIIGGDPDRLELAADAAAELGLEVWFSPYPLELDPDRILTLFSDCAERAERLRRKGATVVFVAGVELSVMNRGFLPGESPEDRVGQLMRRPERRPEALRELGVRVNAFLRDAAATVRERFGGGVTYAAIQFEQVDWAPFDFTTFELIRSAEIADGFRDAVRTLAGGPKPLALTGFGTAAYRGAGDRGGRVLEVVEYDPDTRVPVRLNDVYERDEAGQAAYLSELLEVFDAEGVDSAFVFLFALADYPHRPDGDPRDDLDRASLGIVKPLEGRRGHTYPDMEWEPKEAFAAVAQRYRR
nr:Ctg346 [Streptomyces sp. SCSIO 40066]